MASVGAAVKHPQRFLRSAARLPLEQAAAARIAELPVVEVTDVIPSGTHEISVVGPETRHGWSLGLAEQLILQLIVRARNCESVFEIGTFNGGTTLILAESLPDHGRVWTLDLDPAAFDASQAPADFHRREVGTAYRGSPVARKITQLLGNSLTYDFSSYRQSADLVLVDGGHEYEHGYSDTRNALEIAKPGAIVVWDDFEPYWHGLVNGICDAMEGRRLGRLAGTSLAVHVIDD